MATLFHVDIGTLFQSPKELAIQAMESVNTFSY